MNTFHRVVLAGCLAALATPPVAAEDTPSATAFDCWISPEGSRFQTEYIRCIEDRDRAPAGTQPVDPEVVQALDDVHHAFHHDSVPTLDALVASHGEIVRNGHYWKIRIISYPSEWSWQDGRPQELVRTTVCHDSPECAVNFRRD